MYTYSTSVTPNVFSISPESGTDGNLTIIGTNFGNNSGKKYFYKNN